MALHLQLHQHLRERAHRRNVKKNLEPYPHPKPQYRMLDITVNAVSFVFPFTVVPQILDVWVLQQVEGVSLLSWSLFLVLTIPLLVYSIVHKEKRLILMYSLFTLFYILLVLGILIQRSA